MQFGQTGKLEKLTRCGQAEVWDPERVPHTLGPRGDRRGSARTPCEDPVPLWPAGFPCRARALLTPRPHRCHRAKAVLAAEALNERDGISKLIGFENQKDSRRTFKCAL